MAKNFGSAGSAKKIGEVVKASNEKAQVIVVKMIGTDNLMDYPMNQEDIEDTADLENSIRELGFIDPIEVTPFDGKYMIVSGHRRRAAGVKAGIDTFPCIVKTFANDSDMQNYVLLANSQRDSAKDPLLFCKRYKAHEAYLKDIGFKGKVRDEVARRLGVSTPQADRYNNMNKIILPVWDMVRDEVVGMSSVLPMAKHSIEEQGELLEIMRGAIAAGHNLTRDMMKSIVDLYRSGKKTWAEIADLPRDSGLPLNPFINSEPGETREPVQHNRNDEMRRGVDPIAAEADKVDAARAAWEKEQEEREDNEDFSDNKDTPDKKPMSEEEKQIKRAKDIKKGSEKLISCLSDIYTFESEEDAEETLRSMASSVSLMLDEMYTIAREYSFGSILSDSLEETKAKVKQYMS